MNYNEIKLRLVTIKRLLKQLEKESQEISKLLNKSLLINEKNPEADALLDISGTTTKIINEIDTFILPEINEKL